MKNSDPNTDAQELFDSPKGILSQKEYEEGIRSLFSQFALDQEIDKDDKGISILLTEYFNGPHTCLDDFQDVMAKKNVPREISYFFFNKAKAAIQKKDDSSRLENNQIKNDGIQAELEKIFDNYQGAISKEVFVKNFPGTPEELYHRNAIQLLYNKLQLKDGKSSMKSVHQSLKDGGYDVVRPDLFRKEVNKIPLENERMQKVPNEFILKFFRLSEDKLRGGENQNGEEKDNEIRVSNLDLEGFKSYEFSEFVELFGTPKEMADSLNAADYEDAIERFFDKIDNDKTRQIDNGEENIGAFPSAVHFEDFLKKKSNSTVPKDLSDFVYLYFNLKEGKPLPNINSLEFRALLPPTSEVLSESLNFAGVKVFVKTLKLDAEKNEFQNLLNYFEHLASSSFYPGTIDIQDFADHMEGVPTEIADTFFRKIGGDEKDDKIKVGLLITQINKLYKVSIEDFIKFITAPLKEEKCEQTKKTLIFPADLGNSYLWK